MTVDWEAYRQCPVCFAELAKPCWSLVGFYDGEVVSVEAAEPHTSRKLRAGR